MTELPPKKEKGPEPEKFDARAMVKRQIEKFLSLSDEPGPVLSDKQEFELSRQAIEGSEAEKQWNIHKHGTKYRRNTLSVPLMAADIFLDSHDSDYLPAATKEDLLQKVKTAEEYITDVKGKPFTKENVQEVVDLVNEIKKYL